ncbi:MAG: hypothetical protein FJ125_17490, partial [Deltaproteobacteria bacterium]|nr:hypothetical protein [Deltaproteobacteria bacterium]
MKSCRAWLGLPALLVLCTGCGEEFTATLNVDMSACFVAEGKRGRGMGRSVGKDGDTAWDGVCVTALPARDEATRQTMCLAIKVAGKDLATA